MNKIVFLCLLLAGCGGAVDDGQLFEPPVQIVAAGNGGEPSANVLEAGAGGHVDLEAGGSGGEQAGAGGEVSVGGEAGAGGQGACIPKTFEEACPPVGGQQMSCGGALDGCGGVVDCGECSGLNVCDHVHNTCLSCTPTTSQVAQNYCKENEPEHPKAYQDCAFTFHDCIRADAKYWCCSF